MIRIAFVGDIGSGKTFYSKLFKYPVFNADLVVSNLYQKDKSLFRKIKKKFPNKISNFPLKKQEVLKIIFQKQKNLNSSAIFDRKLLDDGVQTDTNRTPAHKLLTQYKV